MSAYRRNLPLIPVGGWRARAACAPRVQEMLWDDRVDGETDAQRDRRLERGKAVCRTQCPVRAQCSAEADWRIDEGIRGGHKLPTLGIQHSGEDEELLRLLQKGLPLDEAARISQRRVRAAEAV